MTTVAQRKSPLSEREQAIVARVVSQSEVAEISGADVWTIRIDQVGTVWVHLKSGAALPYNAGQFKARVQALKGDARTQRANECEVIGRTASSFTVRNLINGNIYTVEPQRYFKNQRCNCLDCLRRGVKCKHQIAVANWQASSRELVTA